MVSGLQRRIGTLGSIPALYEKQSHGRVRRHMGKMTPPPTCIVDYPLYGPGTGGDPTGAEAGVSTAKCG